MTILSKAESKAPKPEEPENPPSETRQKPTKGAKKRRRLRDEYDGIVVKLEDGESLRGHFGALDEIEWEDPETGETQTRHKLTMWPEGQYEDGDATPYVVFLGAGGVSKLQKFISAGDIGPGTDFDITNNGLRKMKNGHKVRDFSFGVYE